MSNHSDWFCMVVLKIMFFSFFAVLSSNETFLDEIAFMSALHAIKNPSSFFLQHKACLLILFMGQ